MRGGTHLQSGVVPRTDYTYPSTKLTAMEQLLLPHLPLRNNGSWSACNDYALHTLIQNLKIICNRKWVAAIWTVHQKPLTQPKGEGLYAVNEYVQQRGATRLFQCSTMCPGRGGGIMKTRKQTTGRHARNEPIRGGLTTRSVKVFLYQYYICCYSVLFFL